MSIHVVCSQCGKSYDVPDNRAGQTGKCSCGATMRIPGGENVERPAASQPTQQPAETRPPVEPRSPFGPPPTENPYDAPKPPSPYGPSTGQVPGGVPGMPRYGLAAAPKRPLALTIMIIVMWVLYGIGMIGVILGIAGTSMMMGSQGMGAMAGIIIGALVFALVLIAAMVVISIFLWKGKNWARITIIILQALSALSAISQLFRSGSNQAAAAMMPNQALNSPGWAIVQILICAAIIFILLMQSTKDYCSN